MQPSFRSRAVQTLVITTMLVFSALAMAEPTIQDINQAIKDRDLAKADSLMQEVISAHPESAKAHFKYAEILAAEGQLNKAQAELTAAEKIKPDLDFVNPNALKALKHKLGQSQQTSSPSSSTSPWLTWIGIGLVAFIGFSIFRSLARRPQVQPNYAANPQAPNGYGPQGAYPTQGGGMGSGIMGGLATGAAVGAGIVAGEVLMHKILDNEQPSNHDSSSVRNEPAPDNLADISGNDFVDNSNSWENDSSFDSGSSFDSDSGGDWS